MSAMPALVGQLARPHIACVRLAVASLSSSASNKSNSKKRSNDKKNKRLTPNNDPARTNKDAKHSLFASATKSLGNHSNQRIKDIGTVDAGYLDRPMQDADLPPIVTTGVAATNKEGSDRVSELSKTSLFYHGYGRLGGSGSSGTYRLTKVFPILNLSALLDSTEYCRKSALRSGTSTISGGDATLRLLRGREALVDVLRNGCVDRKKKRGPPQPHAVVGHGVPYQLLQNHVDMADSLLTHHDLSAECSFNNFQGDLSFKWMRLRSRNGENRAYPWPPTMSADHQEWEQQMDLYLLVMNRLVSTLGLAILTDSPSLLDEVSTKNDDDDEDDFVVKSNQCRYSVTPHHWSVELLRGVAYPPHLVPAQPHAPVVIVEWTQRDRISSPGHVCIRLQGVSSKGEDSLLGRGEKLPVTLVFDACFRNQLR